MTKLSFNFDIGLFAISINNSVSQVDQVYVKKFLDLSKMFEKLKKNNPNLNF